MPGHTAREREHQAKLETGMQYYAIEATSLTLERDRMGAPSLPGKGLYRTFRNSEDGMAAKPGRRNA